MTTSYDEVLNQWGREILLKRGIEVSEDEKIVVDLGTYDEGYCETCSYVVGTINISVANDYRREVEIFDSNFSDILNELIAISISYANKN